MAVIALCICCPQELVGSSEPSPQEVPNGCVSSEGRKIRDCILASKRSRAEKVGVLTVAARTEHRAWCGPHPPAQIQCSAELCGREQRGGDLTRVPVWGVTLQGHLVREVVSWASSQGRQSSQEATLTLAAQYSSFWRSLPAGVGLLQGLQGRGPSKGTSHSVTIVSTPIGSSGARLAGAQTAAEGSKVHRLLGYPFLGGHSWCRASLHRLAVLAWAPLA